MSSSTPESSSSEGSRHRRHKKKKSSMKKKDKKIRKLKKELEKARRHRSRHSSTSNSTDSQSSYARSRERRAASSRRGTPDSSTMRDRDRRTSGRESTYARELSYERYLRETPYSNPRARRGDERSTRGSPSLSSSRSRSRSPLGKRQSNEIDSEKNPDTRGKKSESNEKNPESTGKNSELTEQADELLQLLGDGASDKDLVSGAIHPSIAKLWSKILQSGLPKEIQQEVVKNSMLPKTVVQWVRRALTQK
ncbi:putative RNA-binding protein Luc7-like 2 [Leptopilina boulardi]|uniref:putative RNA-binding protein Luc7-like 2 n=1 Tax=Leptopilina boulardi TaxID=63433 RepID=UPI0021F68B5C|nr:putative RNA-binding protein Luc7-like 2 [Leptopilina boulardi]